MSIKEILAKVAKKEELTDEELTFLSSYDIDKSQNEVAAAARRKAESEAARVKEQLQALEQEKTEAQRILQEKENEKLSDTEKYQAELKKIQDQVQGLQKAKEEAEQAKAAMMRKQDLAELRKAHKINWVSGVKHSILDQAFESEFADVEDLNDKDVVKSKIEAFIEENKSVISSDGNYGSGNRPKPIEVQRQELEEMTPEQREKDMRSKNMLR